MNYLVNYSITLVFFVIVSSVPMLPRLVQASADRSLEVIAVGITRQDAINNGLTEALRRIKGFELETTRETQNVLKEEMDVISGLEVDMTRFSSEQVHDVSTKTRGYIESYQVLDTRSRGDGGVGFEVTLLVHIPTYKPPGQNSENRPKIAVLPLRNSREYYEMDSYRIPAKEFSELLSQELVSLLTQTRRFAVLERDYVNEIIQEKDFIRYFDTTPGEVLKLGNSLAADYLLVGKIKEAAITTEPYRIVIIDKSGFRSKAVVTVEYRIIMMATGQVKWSDTLDLRFNNDDIVKISEDGNLVMIESALVKEVAERIIESSLENIYPVRIVSFQRNGSYVLNQGGKGIKVGDCFDVYSFAEELYDPYSGESVGYSEERVGTIRVSRVTAKVSYADLVEGSEPDMQKGAFCRRPVADCNPIPMVAPSNQPFTGVYLPFD